MGTGDIVEQGPQIITAFEALEKVIAQMDSTIDAAEMEVAPEQAAPEEDTLIDVLPGFPERIEGEILFLDADNVSTDGIYPGKYVLEPLLTDRYNDSRRNLRRFCPPDNPYLCLQSWVPYRENSADSSYSRQIHLPRQCTTGEDG